MNTTVIILALVISLNSFCLYGLSITIHKLNMRIKQLERRQDKSDYKVYIPETRL